MYIHDYLDMKSILEQLSSMTVVVADTGDLDSIKKFQPRDATTNPSLILAAAKNPDYVKLIDKALEMDGTITGEHGIGLQKKEYLLKQHPDNVPLMKLIKRSFDPNNILNPGKVFDL